MTNRADDEGKAPPKVPTFGRELPRKGHQIRERGASKTPSRFRLLCPECGVAMGGAGLIPHLVSGKNCTRAHTRDEIVRWSKDRKLPKELREHYRACAKLLEAVVLAGLIRVGPQRYEIPRQGEEFTLPPRPAGGGQEAGDGE